MNVTFDKKDALNGTVSVSITREDYLPTYEKKLKDYGKKANIPGFRAGHAPKGMIEKMVGNSLLLEEINSLASKGLFDYIDSNKLNVLGQPVLNEDTKIDELNKETDYVFSFDLGLSPEIELNITNADKFTKYEAIITDEMIAEEVERMKKRFGSLTDVDQVAENDMIYVSLVELNENGEIMDGGVAADSVPVAVNTIKNEDLSKELIGKEKGAEMTVNVFALFNNDESEMGHALGIQKQTVVDLNRDFKLVLKEIKRTESSELNQDFFDKIYGKDIVTSEEELIEKIKAELSGYFNQQAQHLLEHELFDALVTKHDIQLPDAFLKRWLLERYADKFNNDNIEEAYKPEANYLRNHILEEKIMTVNELKVDEADIRESAVNYTKQMFGAYGNQGLSDELIMSIVDPQLKKEEFRSKMINLSVRQKVNNWLMNTITIEPVQIATADFYKVMEEHNHKNHQHEHNHAHEHEHEEELETL